MSKIDFKRLNGIARSLGIKVTKDSENPGIFHKNEKGELVEFDVREVLDIFYYYNEKKGEKINMEIISAVGFILFVIGLVLNTIGLHIDFKNLKKEIIFDEILLLVFILGINCWMVVSVLQKFKIGEYDGAIITSITIFISFSVSRLSVLIGEKKQIVKRMIEINKKIER